MDVGLWVLKESNKSRFDSYSDRNSVLIISHIAFRDCRVHSFSDNLSRNSCIRYDLVKTGSADPAYDSVKPDQSRRKDTSIAICLSFYFCSDFDSLIFTRSQATERKRSDSCHSICAEILPLRR